LINASDGASDGVEAELLLQERPLAEQALVRPVVRRVVGPNSCPPLASSGAPWSRTQSMAKLSKLNHASRGHRLQLRAQQLIHTVHFPRNGAPGPIFRGCTACRAFGAPPRRRRPRRLIYYRAERVELKVNSRRIHLIPFAISSTVIFSIRHPTYPLLTAQYEYGVAPGV